MRTSKLNFRDQLYYRLFYRVWSNNNRLYWEQHSHFKLAVELLQRGCAYWLIVDNVLIIKTTGISVPSSRPLRDTNNLVNLLESDVTIFSTPVQYVKEDKKYVLDDTGTRIKEKHWTVLESYLSLINDPSYVLSFIDSKNNSWKMIRGLFEESNMKYILPPDKLQVVSTNKNDTFFIEQGDE